MGEKPFNKVNGLIKIYNGIRYLELFDSYNEFYYRDHSIITFSQNDQNLDPPSPLVLTCSILVISPPANVQSFTSPLSPHSFHHNHYLIAKSCYFIDS